YRTGLDAGMRVLHGAKVYAVKAVMPDEVRREFMDLACEVLDGI
ncbi:phage head completion protein, partial [Gordonibacter sp.]